MTSEGSRVVHAHNAIVVKPGHPATMHLDNKQQAAAIVNVK